MNINLTLTQIRNNAVPGRTIFRIAKNQAETFQGFSSKGLLLTMVKTDEGDLVKHWEEKDIKNWEMYLPTI